jgi:hypothetical protein
LRLLETPLVSPSARDADGEVDALFAGDDEASVELAHAMVEARRLAGPKAHDLVEVADPVQPVVAELVGVVEQPHGRPF